VSASLAKPLAADGTKSSWPARSGSSRGRWSESLVASAGSRPESAPRRRRTQAGRNRPLSQITWRTSVAHQSTEDTHAPATLAPIFHYSVKSRLRRLAARVLAALRAASRRQPLQPARVVQAGPGWTDGGHTPLPPGPLLSPEVLGGQFHGLSDPLLPGRRPLRVADPLQGGPPG
jgi:hypothetical protein